MTASAAAYRSFFIQQVQPITNQPGRHLTLAMLVPRTSKESVHCSIWTQWHGGLPHGA